MAIYRFSFILTCIMSFFFFTACEKTGVHTGNEIRDDLISSRWINDCDECPEEDDCCCAIALQNPTTDEALIGICGSSDGSGPCGPFSPSSPCVTISGGGQITTLDPNNTSEGFCLTLGNSFAITNRSSTEQALIKITCQADLVNAQVIFITLDPNETVFYDSNGFCTLNECS